jgi:hypothetical protein
MQQISARCHIFLIDHRPTTASMDDPLPFPPAPDNLVPGSCSHCGLLTDLEPLNEHLSSLRSSRVSAVVDQFLANNHSLPSETRDEITSSLEPNAALLEKVDEAVTQLSDLLNGLKAARDVLADRVQRSRSVLHPLRILPDECLSNIFSHYITHLEGHDDDFFHGVPPQVLENDPWALARISRHWRKVALNTPNVWSNVVIDINLPARQTSWEPSSLSTLNLLLTRSATHPLNVLIYSIYNFAINHPLLQGVLAHCQRWRRLYLNVPIETLTFLEQIYHNLPLLKHLFVYLTTLDLSTVQHSERIIGARWDNFKLARNLRSICILPEFARDIFEYCPQFASQIKKYRTNDIIELPDSLLSFKPSIHLQVLRKLPNLENWMAICLFDDGWPSAADDEQFKEEGGMVVMNSLRLAHLKEKEDYWGAITQVLDRMNAPALSELALEGNLDEGCISSVIDFIDRSDCTHQIQTLTLIDTGRNRGATPFVPLLSKLPFLIELGLQYTSLPPSTPPPLPTQVNSMNDGVDLLLLAGEVLPKGLEILVVSDETGLDESILDGVRNARPGLKVRKVDKLEVR